MGEIWFVVELQQMLGGAYCIHAWALACCSAAAAAAATISGVQYAPYISFGSRSYEYCLFVCLDRALAQFPLWWCQVNGVRSSYSNDFSRVYVIFIFVLLDEGRRFILVSLSRKENQKQKEREKNRVTFIP